MQNIDYFCEINLEQMKKFGTPLTLEEMRPIQLRMMDDLDRICRENNLRYSLSGGSLLGAVRHKGFIPWDDDVDIFMPREDFEKFKKIFPTVKTDEYMVDYNSDQSFYKVFTKIFDNSTTMVQRMVERGGVFIDLFAVDGQPSDYEEFVQYIKDYKKNSKLIRVWTDYFFRSPYFLLRTVVRFLKPRCMKMRKHYIAKEEALLASYPFETSEYAGATMGGSGLKTHQKKEMFLEYTDYEFEGHTYRGIKDYDTYLKLMYGDYMQYPPEDERMPKHMAKFYWKNKVK